MGSSAEAQDLGPLVKQDRGSPPARGPCSVPRTRAAQPFGHDADNEMHAALIKLRGLVASEATFLGAWNDADGRTKDEVLNLLELAAQSKLGFVH